MSSRCRISPASRRQAPDRVLPKQRGRPRGTDNPSSARILEAAREQFAIHGYAGASTRMITARAGVDNAMVSHAFGSKMGLWRAVVDDMTEKVGPVLESLKTEDDIELAIRRMIDMMCDTPFLAHFALTEAMRTGDHADYVSERLTPLFRTYVATLFAKSGRRPGQGAPELMGLAVFSAITLSIAARRRLVRLMPQLEDEEHFRATLSASMLELMLSPAPAD